MPSRIKIWVLAFILINFSNVNGFSNPLSRYAALCAVSEQGDFKISTYVARGWTEDWSRTPDGSYYSNKAPGPVLIAAPLFVIWDHFTTIGLKTRDERDDLRYHLRYAASYGLSFLFQVIPMIFIVGWMGRRLRQWGVSEIGVELSSIAVLFANSSSLFMNTYFGHGLTAVLTLACALALVSGDVFWTAFSLGFALLSDYGTAALIPVGFCLLGLRISRKSESVFTVLRELVPGAALPGLLWCLYHWICFGSVFAIANRFQNPAFVDLADRKSNLWGILSLPNPKIALELLVGPSRGILFTQPWVLVILPVLAMGVLKANRKARPATELTELVIFSLGSLLALFFMNSCFGGWHGGGSPGPRYLSAGLVLIAACVGIAWDELLASTEGRARSAWLARLFLTTLVGSLIVSALLLIVAYSTFIVVPVEPLWPLYWRLLLGQDSGIFWIRVIVCLCILSAPALASHYGSRFMAKNRKIL